MVECLSKQLQPLPPQPEAFVRVHRVLLVLTKTGVRADIVFASLTVERETIRRRIPKQIAGRPIQVASVEDMLRQTESICSQSWRSWQRRSPVPTSLSCFTRTPVSVSNL